MYISKPSIKSFSRSGGKTRGQSRQNRVGICPTEQRVRVFLVILRLIPQGTVDTLGLDRLVGSKALDFKYCRQPTL